jgi:3D (Asp-Asp-Asp) domain-containing protein
MSKLLAVGVLVVAAGGCSSSERWVRGVGNEPEKPETPGGGWVGDDTARPERVVAPAPAPAAAPAPASGDATWRNTYYDFPHEAAGAKSAVVFDAACKPIASVTREFHDKVCVQGSGRLAGGSTISFAKRDCPCASVCPRTDQKICFEKLDPRRFPHGRGATGSAITPFRSVAVDDSLVPLGTPLFIAEFRGLKRLDGTAHDGCFLAEDRGLKVVGRHVDVFTGSEEGTRSWNTAVPSNEGVHVVVGAKECRHLAPASGGATNPALAP